MCPAGARLPFHPRKIRCLVSCMMQKLVSQGADVELVLVRDAEIANLNQRHLHRQGPTNCLAFPDVDRPGIFLGGSLCISLDTLYRECLLYGQAPSTHLCHLLAHGLAHLAGFNHGEEMEAMCVKMEGCGVPAIHAYVT